MVLFEPIDSDPTAFKDLAGGLPSGGCSYCAPGGCRTRGEFLFLGVSHLHPEHTYPHFRSFTGVKDEEEEKWKEENDRMVQVVFGAVLGIALTGMGLF